jgi:peptide/nickel transport system permease protein
MITKTSFFRRLLRAAKDPSFIIGSILVAFLIVVAVLGPGFAPHNPFLRDTLQWIDGELVRAPVDPGPTYPLGTDQHGRDMISLLLYGARTTLTIAFVATSVRLLLGLTLGALAGWGIADRLITTLTELLAAVPGLILAILVVYAVGIRRGEVAFVVALTIVGWGEVAQIVRGHVVAIREEEFIEGARAIGLSSLGILSRHVLPNLLTTMLTLASLEMGSALLLLGELGFVSVFIGGGGTVAGDVGIPTTIFAQVPDWGGMLGTSWRYFRTLPWLPLIPAMAFFVSVFSFNLLGYGMQNFIEKGRFYPSGWSVFRFAGVFVAVLFGAQFILGRSGPESEFKSKAEAFNVERVWTDISFLTQPELGGRAPGTTGSGLAASYIAQQFKRTELTPFPTGSYFQAFPAHHGSIVNDPVLEIMGPNGEVLDTITDGIEYHPASAFDNQGVYRGQLMVIGRRSSNIWWNDGLFLALGSNTIRIPIQVLPDEIVPDVIRPPLFDGPISFMTHDPLLVIRESVAKSLLERIGYDVEELKEWAQDTDGTIAREFYTSMNIRISIGLTYDVIPAVNIVGYVPGVDVRVQTQRILVAVPYTGLSPQNGTIFPGADENASGVAVMLEVLRLWQEQEFQPKRTVVFAALDEVGGRYFIDNPILPSTGSETWTTIIIYGVGAGGEKLARVDERAALSRAFDQSARKMGIQTELLNVDWPFFFEARGGRGWGLPSDDSYSGLVITRVGDSFSGTAMDTREHLDPDLLDEAGEALAFFLMNLSSQ